jgi:hypothetical protein
MRTLIAIVSMMCAGAHAAACERYDAPTTTLSGIVTIKTFFGPPNYGESPEKDARERQAILHLEKPLCTVASGDSPAEHDQMEVTLVPTGASSFRQLDGKRVVVSGSLFHALTGHHHTAVLMKVRPGSR